MKDLLANIEIDCPLHRQFFIALIITMLIFVGMVALMSSCQEKPAFAEEPAEQLLTLTTGD